MTPVPAIYPSVRRVKAFLGISQVIRKCNFLKKNYIPLRCRKTGRVCCCGARETHSATMECLLAKSRSFSNLPDFLDLNGTYI